MESNPAQLTVWLAVVSTLILVNHGQGLAQGQLPPLCQTWNSTTVVCRGQMNPHVWPVYPAQIRATLTQVPPGIPMSVITLDLNGNNITELSKDTFQGLNKLKNLDLSGTNLQNIEIGAFAGLENLERLDMSCPTTQCTFFLHDGLFENLRNLRYLALQTSTDSISDRVFKDLTSLEYLRLVVRSVSSLPDHLFEPLTSLRNLSLAESDPTTMGTHRDREGFLKRRQLWSPLHKLETLTISVHSTSDLHFGPVFGNFSYLHTLEMDLPGTVNLTKQMFLPLSSFLQHLRLHLDGDSDDTFVHNDPIICLEPGLIEVIQSFAHLQTMSLPNIPFSSLVAVMPEFRYTQIQQLSFYMGGVDTITSETLASMKDLEDLEMLSILAQYTRGLEANSFTSLARLHSLSVSWPLDQRPWVHSAGSLWALENQTFSGLSSLTYLDLSNNNIQTIPKGAFDGLRSLYHLDLSNNGLATSEAQPPETLGYLDLSHNNLRAYYHPSLFRVAISFNFEGLRAVHHLNLSHNELESVESEYFPKNITVLDLHYNKLLGVAFSSSLFQIEGLKYLDLSYNSIISVFVSPQKPSTLETLKLDYNAFAGINGQTMKGLVHLRTLTVSHNHIRAIRTGNFQWSVQLTRLDLSHNEISTIASSAFRGLSRLLSLDLSYNKIQRITVMTFEGLGDLTHLNLATNRIAVIGNAFQRLYTMTDLNISSNSISVLNQTALGHVVSRLESLDIADNPFLCDCSIWWSVEWAEGRYDRVANWHNPYPLPSRSYTCSRPAHQAGRRLRDGLSQKLPHDDIREATETTFFGLHCSYGFQPNRLLACVLASSGIFVVMMAIFLTDYNIGHVYYFLWMWAKWRKPRIGEVDDNEPLRYTHDAFIAYNNQDVGWVRYEAIENLEPDYSLVIHDRDFIGGVPIVTNIADAVENSRRTVCIITRNFLKSKWCEYEFQLAQYHMFEPGGKRRLILVFLERIPDRMLKRFRHLNAVMQRDTYLTWPDDVRKRPLFWKRLRDALGEPLPRNQEAQDQIQAPLDFHEQQAQAPLVQQANPSVRNIQEQDVNPEPRPDDQWYGDNDNLPLLPL